MLLPKPIVKQPDEKFPITVNFAPELDKDSDTISSIVTKVTNLATSADSSTEIKDGAPSATTKKATQGVKGGGAGERHRIEFEITTTLGKKFEAEVDLHVVEV
jgi:hypothetical protein